MELGEKSTERSSEWRRHTRRVLGREPMSLRADPFHHALRVDPHPALRETAFTPVLGVFRETARRIRQIAAAWTDQNYTALKKLIEDWGELFDPAMPHAMTYFVGLGGVDVFVRILCEPPRLFERNSHFNYPRSELAHTLMMVLKILTEVLICHNELSWNLYDRYPGVFFRLLELIAVPSLRQAATPMLEHLISNLGPIFEIARTPLMIQLLRSEDDGVVASVYRVIALLIVPFIALNHTSLHSRRLPHPESLLPLKRLQRVIDSNVLWLLAEPNLMERLIKLCEVRAGGIRLLDGNYVTLVTPYTADIMSYYLSQTNPLLSAAESVLISSIEDGYFGEEEPMEEGGIASIERVLGDLADRDFIPAEGGGGGGGLNAPLAAETLPSDVLGLLQQSMEDGIETPNPMPEEIFRVDFSWFLGFSDARQRWRLQDLTLTMEEDDTRARLYYGAGDAETVRRFHAENQSVMDWLAAKPPLSREANEYLKIITLRSVVDSQSEILFVLNVMLSTFYFSDVWTKMKGCRWIPRANLIYNAVFFLNEDLPPLVDGPQRVELSDGLFRLPRYQTPPVLETNRDGSEGDRDSVIAPNRPLPVSSTRYPSHWWARSFHELLGPGGSTYRKDYSLTLSDDQDDFLEDKHHQHGPETIRKLELVHCIYEFWNTQDRHECGLLHSEDLPQHARWIAEKMARTLASHKEEGCVESALSHALEGYLRCFSFPFGVRRNAPDAPQTFLGKTLLRSILEHRVYNATRVPGLITSLKPRKRFEALLALASELLRYHYDNLRILAAYVNDEVSLLHLNDPKSTCKCAQTVFRSRDPHPDAAGAVEAILQCPPLERGEFEPFGSVLLARVMRYGCEFNLFIRAIALSVTPGLRSSRNYISRGSPITETIPVAVPMSSYSHVGDIFTGYPVRLAYIRRVSRTFVLRINEALATPAGSRRQAGETAFGGARDSGSIADLLLSLLTELENAPHRLPLSERPFPDLFSARDRRRLRVVSDAILRRRRRRGAGGAGPPPAPSTANPPPNGWQTPTAIAKGQAAATEPEGERESEAAREGEAETDEDEALVFGPPPAWRRPLFGPDRDDAAGLRALAALPARLLADPAALLFALLAPLHAERVGNTRRLCVVTTALLLLLREAHRGPGGAAIDAVLTNLRPLAARGYHRWRRERERDGRCGGDGTSPAGPPARCSKCAGNGSDRAGARGGGRGRCAAFWTFGECFPGNDVRAYYLRCGGCFYRNFFRLLCVWVGHYAACQKYLETLYYSTEVAFAEYKTVLFYLLCVLPTYFFPTIDEQEEGEDGG